MISYRDRFSGIGFVFSSSDPYCGIDLDNCIDDGKVKAWAETIVEKLKAVSYGEVSPSGNGIKFWTRATLRAEMKHKVYIDEPASVTVNHLWVGRTRLTCAGVISSINQRNQ